jgi:hypothetical protein
VDCLTKIWQHEGLLGFFKGCVPNVLKMAPAAAITFVVYEKVTYRIYIFSSWPMLKIYL